MVEAISIFATTLQDRMTRRPVPASPIPLKFPEADDPSEVIASIGYAEGQSFVIEYRDSNGIESTRRITVWGIGIGAAGVPVLVAKCHERNAQRTFRIDRITACIDYDGEVHSDVPLFLSESFGMSKELAETRAGAEDEALWHKIRAAVRADALLLVALSNSDGLIDPREIDAALAHCERAAEANGLFLTEGAMRSLQRYLRRLRPTVADIERIRQELLRREPDETIRLLTAAVHLIDADGRRHPAEISMINNLATELIGTPVV